MEGASCAACGNSPLRLRWRVAGAPGPEGLAPTTDRYGAALADIARCPRCGHMQLADPPASAELADAYALTASDDYLDEERGQRLTANRLLETIERHATRGALLDLGCWVGFLLDEARRRGWEVAGIEPSEFASRYARERLRLDVRTASLDAADLPAGRYDAVVMADVLEHLPDPAAALREIRGLLRLDGVLALALPDAGSAVARLLGRRWWSVIPTHVQYFTRASLRGLLRREGFDPITEATAPKTFSVRYYVGRLGGYDQRLSRLLVGAVDAIGIAERQWTPDFRDRMLVLARRDGGRQPPSQRSRGRS